MANYGYNNESYSTTSYGAQGGVDGGGFLGGSQMGSQTGAEGGRTYSKDSLRPVTIKQIIEAHQPHPDSEFKIDGIEVTQITFVGQIQTVSSQATNTTYKLDDGTGLIDVKQWIDGEVDPENSTPLPKENDYIRIWGRLRAFNNKRHVGAHIIRPITDFNEITYHLLEATAVHLYFLKGPPPTAESIKNESSTGMFVDNIQGGTSIPNGTRKLPSNLSTTSKRVYNLLLSDAQSNEGLHVSLVAQKLGLQLTDAFKAGDELLGAGVIYTTVDDDTWAVLEV